jgi:hypothetical protein
MEARCPTPPAGFDPAALAEFHFRGARLFDKRRTDRLVHTARRIMSHPDGTLPKKLPDRADLAGLYRLAACPDVTHARVLAPHRARTLEAMAAHDGVVLIVHDTTELDFSGTRALREQLGQIGHGQGHGYLCHNSLAVGLTAGGGRRVLGLASQVLHKRRDVPKGETPAQKRRHPDRESRLWLAGCRAVGAMPAGRRWVDISDRGSDTFEYLCYAVDNARHFVARCARDRNLAGDDHVGADRVYQKLRAYAAGLPTLGERRVEAGAGPGKKARTARVRVAAGPVTLAVPDVARGDYGPAAGPLALWAIHVAEVDAPAGVEPLEWILLTDLPADTFAQASERVDWYAHRPVIEDYHKGQKTGLGIERPRFADAARLEPVVALLSVVAAVLLGVRDAARTQEAQCTPATALTPRLYVTVLAAHAARRAAARGPRARMPVTADMSVREFVTEVAKLGGFQARRSDGPPGWQTLWRGWAKLQLMVEGATAILGEKCVYE